MKKTLIVHCWGGNLDYCWYPDTKKQLEAQGFEVFVPTMPETDTPKLALWLPVIQKIITEPLVDWYLVGHSAGVITILRFLERVSPGQQISGAIFVAGFTDNLGFPELTNFFETPLDFTKIKKAAKHVIAIQSDNDPYVPMKFGDVFKEKLGAQVIIKHEMGHFSGPVDDTASVTSLPDVAEAIVSMYAFAFSSSVC